eukprot:5568725-Pleurochrysis_carterae.AAC.1
MSLPLRASRRLSRGYLADHPRERSSLACQRSGDAMTARQHFYHPALCWDNGRADCKLASAHSCTHACTQMHTHIRLRLRTPMHMNTQQNVHFKHVRHPRTHTQTEIPAFNA